MKEIILTRGFSTQVDDADFEDLSRFRWNALVVKTKNTSKVYAVRNEGRSKVYMHRYLMGAPKGLDVDHVDGNGLNNQRGNIRIATRTQNRQNTNARTGATGFIGVCKADTIKYPRFADKPYKAFVYVGGRQTHVGYFPTAEEAAFERDKRSIEVAGEFANLNFPERFAR